MKFKIIKFWNILSIELFGFSLKVLWLKNSNPPRAPQGAAPSGVRGDVPGPLEPPSPHPTPQNQVSTLP